MLRKISGVALAIAISSSAMGTTPAPKPVVVEFNGDDLARAFDADINDAIVCSECEAVDKQFRKKVGFLKRATSAGVALFIGVSGLAPFTLGQQAMATKPHQPKPQPQQPVKVNTHINNNPVNNVHNSVKNHNNVHNTNKNANINANVNKNNNRNTNKNANINANVNKNNNSNANRNNNRNVNKLNNGNSIGIGVGGAEANNHNNVNSVVKGGNVDVNAQGGKGGNGTAISGSNSEGGNAVSGSKAVAGDSSAVAGDSSATNAGNTTNVSNPTTFESDDDVNTYVFNPAIVNPSNIPDGAYTLACDGNMNITPAKSTNTGLNLYFVAFNKTNANTGMAPGTLLSNKLVSMCTSLSNSRSALKQIDSIRVYNPALANKLMEQQLSGLLTAMLGNAEITALIADIEVQTIGLAMGETIIETPIQTPAQKPAQDPGYYPIKK